MSLVTRFHQADVIVLRSQDVNTHMNTHMNTHTNTHESTSDCALGSYAYLLASLLVGASLPLDGDDCHSLLLLRSRLYKITLGAYTAMVVCRLNWSMLVAVLKKPHLIVVSIVVVVNLNYLKAGEQSPKSERLVHAMDVHRSICITLTVARCLTCTGCALALLLAFALAAAFACIS